MKTLFVSSTFRDMQFERDAIREITLPIINQEAITYGQSVAVCDLRWGVDTGDMDSELGNRKVLDVCLDEIDRCQPPMVVLLGYRYGWVPGTDLIENAANRKSFGIEDLEMSVTALEIEYGSLATQEKLDHTLFYFREIEGLIPEGYDSEDEFSRKRIEELKNRIRVITGDRVKTYKVSVDEEDPSKLSANSIQDFAQMLAADVLDLVRDDWRANQEKSLFMKEYSRHRSFGEEKGRSFCTDYAPINLFTNLVMGERPLLILQGPSGCGKSTILSRLYLQDMGVPILPVFCGLTSESSSATDILRYIIYATENLLGVDHLESPFGSFELSMGGLDRLRERYLLLCDEMKRRNQEQIILIDAVDQLADDTARNSFVFLPPVDGNIHVVMTCLDTFSLDRLQSDAGYHKDDMNHVELFGYQENDQRQLIKGLLKLHGKELNTAVIKAIMNLPSAGNPLYLSLLIQRLTLMNRDDFLQIKAMGDDIEAISNYQIQLIRSCPPDTASMSAELLREAARRINPKMIEEVVTYLSISRHGLRSTDLETLLGDKWEMLDFAHFISYMQESFIQREDGRYDFSHKSIREGFIQAASKDDSYRKALLEHFIRLDNRDEIKIQEMTWQCQDVYVHGQSLREFAKHALVNYITEIKRAQNDRGLNLAAKDLAFHALLDDSLFLNDILEMPEEELTVQMMDFVAVELRNSMTFDFGAMMESMYIFHNAMIITYHQVESVKGMSSSDEKIAAYLAHFHSLYTTLYTAATVNSLRVFRFRYQDALAAADVLEQMGVEDVRLDRLSIQLLGGILEAKAGVFAGPKADFDRAVKDLENMLEDSDKSEKERTKIANLLLNALYQMTDLFIAWEKYEDSNQYYHAMEKPYVFLLNKADEESIRNIMYAKRMLGYVFYVNGESKNALRDLHDSCDTCEYMANKLQNADWQMELGIARRYLALAYADLGEYDKATDYSRSAIQILEGQTYGNRSYRLYEELAEVSLCQADILFALSGKMKQASEAVNRLGVAYYNIKGASLIVPDLKIYEYRAEQIKQIMKDSLGGFAANAMIRKIEKTLSKEKIKGKSE